MIAEILHLTFDGASNHGPSLLRRSNIQTFSEGRDLRFVRRRLIAGPTPKACNGFVKARIKFVGLGTNGVNRSFDYLELPQVLCQNLPFIAGRLIPRLAPEPCHRLIPLRRQFFVLCLLSQNCAFDNLQLPPFVFNFLTRRDQRQLRRQLLFVEFLLNNELLAIKRQTASERIPTGFKFFNFAKPLSLLAL